MQENDLAYRSPPYRATQAANSLWGKNFITCEKIVRPRFMCRLPVVSGIMAHSEVEIVPVLDVGILTHSQSLIPFAGIFPWTAVTPHIILCRPTLSMIMWILALGSDKEREANRITE